MIMLYSKSVFNEGRYLKILVSVPVICLIHTLSVNKITKMSYITTSGSSEDDDDDDTSDGNKLNTKCLGDFGDGVGDKLCCGQTGVIQNEHAKYTCPESHPYCRGYKCGESWGACYSVEDED